MKRFMAGTAFLFLIAAGGASWAGPAEEVAQIAAPRLKALYSGDVDAYVDAYADDAVFYSSLSPLRIEGKDAIRAFFLQLVQMYPKRPVFIRQPIARVYNDNLVIQGSYAVLNWTNAKGEYETFDTRVSTVWTKMDGKWKIVDQHFSRLPVPGHPH